MIHALALVLLPLVMQGTMSVTVVGDATGFSNISKSDSLNHGRHYWIEPQTRSFVRTERSEQGRRMVFGGRAGPWFHIIARVRFSPDGTRLAYIGRSQEGETIVVDGEVIAHLERGGSRLVQLPPLDDFLAGEPEGSSGGRLIFSPDSQHIAWVLATRAIEGPAYKIMLDFEPVAAVDRIGFLTFTPDSELVWSTCANQGPGHLVVEGEAGPEFESIDRLRFDPESGSFAYRGFPVGAKAAQVLVNHEVVIDLRESPYAGRQIPPDGLQFSPDLRRIAVLIESADPSAGALDLLVNGERVDGARRGAPIVFTPGGQLFHQRPGGEIVIGDTVHDSLGTVLEVSFAPVGDKRLTVTSVEGGVLVIDSTGGAHGPSSAAPQLEFSANGAHSMFVLNPPSESQDLYLDGRLVLADAGRILEASFSDDGARLFVTTSHGNAETWTAAARQAQLSGVQLIGIDVARRRHEATSPDGTTHAAFVRTELAGGGATFDLLINGQATGEVFDQSPAAFGFDDDGVLRFLSRRGTEVLRCEYRP